MANNHFIRVWDFDDQDRSFFVELWSKRERPRREIIADAHSPERVEKAPNSKLYDKLRERLMVGEPRMIIDGLSKKEAEHARDAIEAYLASMGRACLRRNSDYYVK